MSIVVTTQTKDLIIASADSRLCDPEGILSENFNKLYKINEKIIVGFTGSAMLPKILFVENDIVNIEWIDISNARSCAHSLIGAIGGKINEDKNTGVLINGLDGNNNSYFAVFNTTETSFQTERIIQDDKTYCTVSGPSGYEHLKKWYEDILKNTMGYGSTKDIIIKAQKTFIEECSGRYDSINTNVKVEVICRGID